MRVKWVDGLLVAGIGLIAIGIGMNYRAGQKETKVELIRVGAHSNAPVQIDVGGEVMRPGVYELAGGARVNEALAAAGGLSAAADRGWVEKNLNKARILMDGEKIFIPNKSQITNNKLQTNSKSQITNVLGVEDSLININTATVEELDRLPGIGPALAGRIIDYREKNGGFRDINELKLVSGIGDKLFAKIHEAVVVR